MKVFEPTQTTLANTFVLTREAVSTELDHAPNRPQSVYTSSSADVIRKALRLYLQGPSDPCCDILRHRTDRSRKPQNGSEVHRPRWESSCRSGTAASELELACEWHRSKLQAL